MVLDKVRARFAFLGHGKHAFDQSQIPDERLHHAVELGRDKAGGIHDLRPTMLAARKCAEHAERLAGIKRSVMCRKDRLPLHVEACRGGGDNLLQEKILSTLIVS